MKKASELAKILGGALEGADVELVDCAGLEEARPGDLSFCKDPKHAKLVETTQASAVLLPKMSVRTWGTFSAASVRGSGRSGAMSAPVPSNTISSTESTASI